MSALIRSFLTLLSLLALLACAAPAPEAADIAGLERTIRGLSPDIDADEAARVARLSHSYSLDLAKAYHVTDPPLIHNAKVNQGLRPRGLCWHWADDLEARLRQENLQSLRLHRAIANASNLRIEHSTVIVSARDGGMEDGVILDPWRYGGRLFWAPVPEDTRYTWVPRAQVFEDRQKHEAAVTTQGRIF